MRLLVCATACTLLLAVGFASPAAAQSGRCDISGKERKLGATYVTSLAVKSFSCRRAERVVRAFHRCRTKAGGKRGRCRGRVERFRCAERRGRTVAGQYDSRVTCTRGKARVVHNYTQFT
jgi:hypothetical protein